MKVILSILFIIWAIEVVIGCGLFIIMLIDKLKKPKHFINKVKKS